MDIIERLDGDEFVDAIDDAIREIKTLRESINRLLSLIHAAPDPFEKTDLQIAQEYRNWFYGVRLDKLSAREQK